MKTKLKKNGGNLYYFILIIYKILKELAIDKT